MKHTFHDTCFVIPLAEALAKGQKFIGPKGGEWADAAHTIHWDEKKHGKPQQMGLFTVPKEKQAAFSPSDVAAVDAVVGTLESIKSEDERGTAGPVRATVERVIGWMNRKDAKKALTLAHKAGVVAVADGLVVSGKPTKAFLKAKQAAAIESPSKPEAYVDPKDKPWAFTASGFLAVTGVHEPWIAEISPMQMGQMGKQAKRAYEKKRAKEWDVSAKAKQEWASAVFAAHEAGEFDKDTPGVNPEALEAVRIEKTRRREKKTKQTVEQARKANQITDLSQVKVGMKIHHIAMGGGEVVKVSKKSLRIKLDSDMGMAKVYPGSITWVPIQNFEEQVKSGVHIGPPSEMKKSERFVINLVKAGPFIGPRGGKWADPKHTIPWKLEAVPGKGKEPEQWGKLPPGKTPREHLKMAQQLIRAYGKAFPQALKEIEEIVGDGKIAGRVKTVESALGKLMRKPDEYPSADKLQDGSGLRVIHNTIREVQATVASIKAKYKVLDEDDYIAKPQGNYRSYHLIIEGPGGLAMEVQVRTGNQNVMADWSHNVYKPVTAEQAKYRSEPEVLTYEKSMAAFMWAADNERSPPPPVRPPCTKVVSQAFGCL